MWQIRTTAVLCSPLNIKKTAAYITATQNTPNNKQ